MRFRLGAHEVSCQLLERSVICHIYNDRCSHNLLENTWHTRQSWTRWTLTVNTKKIL